LKSRLANSINGVSLARYPRPLVAVLVCQWLSSIAPFGHHFVALLLNVDCVLCSRKLKGASEVCAYHGACNTRFYGT
jgi:hypothetical protein